MVQSLANEQSPASDADAAVDQAVGGASAAGQVETQFHELSRLLSRLEPGFSEGAPNASPEYACENQLVRTRLGVAGGLFAALRSKHAETASHSLRVALGCSAWALALDLKDEERDALEVAALLHDIGKIGVPDCVLLKPLALTAEEHAVMDHYRLTGLQILESCCDRADVLDIVRHAPAWFDGSRMRVAPIGQLPRAARMLAIVDAFDSMTTAQVYRPAMSQDQAIKELCDCAGTQFDPQLVLNFAELHSGNQQKLHHRVARRWLQDLDPETTNNWWQVHAPRPPEIDGGPTTLFSQKLLENMYDGVIFLDANLQVVLWNRGAERLTGITGGSMIQRPFTPTLLDMRDERGSTVPDPDCPVAYAVRTGVQSLRRVTIRGRDGRDVVVDAHAIPIVGADGAAHGASLLMHDASGQASLEERCHSLYEQATRDPLTQLANRAEFDRVFSLFVGAHLERRLPCSLIMCDIDRFKLVNDTYGHPAGDEAIKAFAQLLKNSCRPGDLVARYGGEEFVVLCADCSNPTAARRAEELRKAFCSLPLPGLGGKSCSASFGVTEIQPGDTAETMLNRADRGLLMAKEGGRNMVVQLGTGMREEPKPARRGFWFWQTKQAGALLDRQLVTNVPLNLVIEKLRGFIADHGADVLSIEDEGIELLINPGKVRLLRRQTDKPVPMLIEIDFAYHKVKLPGQAGVERGTLTQTRIHVVIRPRRARDRRRAGAAEQAQRVLASLRSYLVANDLDADEGEGVIRKATSLFAPWRGKK